MRHASPLTRLAYVITADSFGACRRRGATFLPFDYRAMSVMPRNDDLGAPIAKFTIKASMPLDDSSFRCTLSFKCAAAPLFDAEMSRS